MSAAATASPTIPSPSGHGATASSDNTLMARVAEGDSAAFDELYRRHSRSALLLARKLCASSELAEEVAQEAFISLWRSAHLYRPGRGNLNAWLATMVRNRAVDAWRRASIRPVEVEAFEEGPAQLRAAVEADSESPGHEVALSLIAGLPDGQKQAVFLAYFAGLTQAEIAAAIDQPLGTVKSRIRLGLQKLRQGAAGEHARGSAARPPQARPALRLAPAR